jgi:hypothetical protein
VTPFSFRNPAQLAQGRDRLYQQIQGTKPQTPLVEEVREIFRPLPPPRANGCDRL